jgi:hypothetical protein
VHGGAPARGIGRSNPVSAERGATHIGRLGDMPSLFRCQTGNHLLSRRRLVNAEASWTNDSIGRGEPGLVRDLVRRSHGTIVPETCVDDTSPSPKDDRNRLRLLSGANKAEMPFSPSPTSILMVCAVSEARASRCSAISRSCSRLPSR